MCIATYRVWEPFLDVCVRVCTSVYVRKCVCGGGGGVDMIKSSQPWGRRL